MSSAREKFDDLNRRLTEATKEVTFKSYFPALLFFITFALIDLLYCQTIMVIPNFPIEQSIQRMIMSNLIALSSLLFMFGKKPSAVIYAVISVFMLCYGFSQLCYSNADNTLFRLNAIFSFSEGIAYLEDILKNIPVSTYVCIGLLLLLTAVSVFLILRFAEDPKEGVPKKFKYITNSAVFICSAVFVAAIPYIKTADFEDGKGSFTAYNYKNFVSADSLYLDNDIFMYLQRDIICTVKQSFVEFDGKEPIDEYFAERAPHEDNEKTGIFKGKSLIVVQMESLDYEGIYEENCPNLTRFMNEGINFANFYSSRFGDTFTFGTELAVNTGLFAPSGTPVTGAYAENSFPYSLPNLFRAQGYSANEFHFNAPDFYNRGVMHETFGYEDYIRYEEYAENKEQNFEVDDTVVTDDGLYNKLTESEHFLDYIITYSAHVPYSENELYLEAIRRHPQLAVSDTGTEKEYYYAMASLTDDMAGELVNRLEEDGLMDDTVILFITDHYCAGIIEERSDNDELISNTPCFIYAKGIEPETVEKVCCTADILPTLVNLFGLGSVDNYVGYDIFDDDYKGFAYFQNLSWIDPDYFCQDGKVTENYCGTEPDEEYIKSMNELAKTRMEVNNRILFTDYYAEEQPD